MSRNHITSSSLQSIYILNMELLQYKYDDRRGDLSSSRETIKILSDLFTTHRWIRNEQKFFITLSVFDFWMEVFGILYMGKKTVLYDGIFMSYTQSGIR